MRLEEVRKALAILRYGTGATGLPPELVAEVKALRRKVRHWMAGPDVVGVGVGKQKTATSTTDDHAITVLIDRTMARTARLRQMPRSVRVPGIDGAVPVTVEVVSALKLQTGARHPVVGGDSISRADGTGGALGCIVRWAQDPDQLYMLSNAHVLAFAGRVKPMSGDEIISPSRDKGGQTGRDRIATLVRWTEFDNGLDRPNVADAAIARLDDGAASPAIVGIGAPAGINTHLNIGMQVQIGTSAGVSTGTIQHLDFGLDLTYPRPGAPSRAFGFSGQVLCSPFTTPGDSGSVVLDSTHHIVGLHLAGSPDHSLFTPIKSVFDLLELSLVTDAPANMPALATAADAQLPLKFKPAVGVYFKAVDILGRTLWGEARGEREEGLIAVAAVVANRTRAQRPQWGLTVEEVCLQPEQFTCWDPGAYREKVEGVGPEDPVFPLCLTVARNTLAGQITDPTGGANHYFNPAESNPSWAIGKPKVTIGKHVFLRL